MSEEKYTLPEEKYAKAREVLMQALETIDLLQSQGREIEDFVVLSTATNEEDTHYEYVGLEVPGVIRLGTLHYFHERQLHWIRRTYWEKEWEEE